MTIDELKRAMQKEDFGPLVPFVIINAGGEQFQAYWHDLFMGVFLVPSVAPSNAFHVSNLDNKGMTVRHLRPDEEVNDDVREALEARGGVRRFELEAT